jgi:hypothetical protein
MPDMFRLKVHSPTIQHSAWRWLLGACLAMLVFGSTLAQSAAPTEGTPGQRVQVEQSLFVDESGRLDFESARTQDFKPFNPLERLAIGDKVAWFRLQIERVDGADGPLFLHLIPAHIGDVTLYSPSYGALVAWNKRKFTQQELISRIQLDEAAQGDVLYLKVESRNNVSIMAFLGSREEIDLHKTKLAVAMTLMSTLTLIALVFFVWRTLRHFSWMSVLICFLLVSYQISVVSQRFSEESELLRLEF